MKDETAKPPGLLDGIDELAEATLKEMPSHMPRVVEEIQRRTREATAAELAAELRNPSSNLQVARGVVSTEALARILINTDLG